MENSIHDFAIMRNPASVLSVNAGPTLWRICSESQWHLEWNKVESNLSRTLYIHCKLMNDVLSAVYGMFKVLSSFLWYLCCVVYTLRRIQRVKYVLWYAWGVMLVYHVLKIRLEDILAFCRQCISIHCMKLLLLCILRQKATIHQVTTMLTISKNVLYPGHHHLLTTDTDDATGAWAMIKVLGH